MNPPTQDPSVKVTLETLERWETELSNWGKWGPKDQRGALNYTTPEKTRAATRPVKNGVTVTLGHFVNEDEAIDSGNFCPTDHQMTSIDPNAGLFQATRAAVKFSLYDGHPQDMTANRCVGDLAIDDMGPGYVTRGILVDMPLLRGVD